MILETIRAAKSIETGEFGSLASAVGVVGPILVAIAALGAVLSLHHNRAGYVVVLVLSSFLALVAFGLVPVVGTLPITTIGETSGAFFVWVVLLLRVVSTLSVVLSLFGILATGREVLRG